MTEKEMNEIFGPTIYKYTTEDAVEDGLLIDVSKDQSVYTCSVYVSAGVYDLLCKVRDNKRCYTDYSGTLHDICFMSTLNRTPTIFYKVRIVGAGRKKIFTLKRVFNADGVTICLPEED